VLLVAGGLASQAGKVVLNSDPAVLLPDGAESVRALRAIERFPSGDVTPAVIVATRPGGLADGDVEALRRLGTDVPGAGEPSPPQLSDDGAAAVVVVPRPSSRCASGRRHSRTTGWRCTWRAGRALPPTSRTSSAASTERC
jgi:putative drug exporter of the RND superfamily